jgi:hypothetical protein
VIVTLDGRPLPIFPCYPNKRPACANGHKDASTDPARIAVLWGGRRGLLVAVPTGEASGIAVLDIDTAGMSWLAAAKLPPTRQHQTRSGGRHLIYRRRPGLRCSQGIRLGVDVRAEGGYVIWWPAAGLAVNGAEVVDWPEWLVTVPPVEGDGGRSPSDFTMNALSETVRAYPQTVSRWSREESYAWAGLCNAYRRLCNTTNQRRVALYREAYALGGSRRRVG